MNFLKNIEKEITYFDIKFKEALSTKATILHKITNYLFTSSGKKIRPICTLLAAGLIGGLNEKVYRGAVLIELIHTATLVHDDIVDDAQLRRSFFSINTIWKNKISVLSGDYFLAKGLSLAVKHKDYDILQLVSETVEKIVEGELYQIDKTKKLNLKEEDYFKIIKLKTAVLFQCCFKIGGSLITNQKENFDKLEKLGLLFGMLFQIRDDILDYRIELVNTGKVSGNDIKEGKINLPLLYALEKMSIIEKNQVYRILRKKSNTKHEIKLVENLVIKYKGIDRAMVIIETYFSQAKSILLSFPESRYRVTLLLLLDFLINRTK